MENEVVDVGMVKDSVDAIQEKSTNAAIYSTIVSMGATKFYEIVKCSPEQTKLIETLVERAAQNAILWHNILVKAEAAADQLLGLDRIEA